MIDIIHRMVYNILVKRLNERRQPKKKGQSATPTKRNGKALTHRNERQKPPPIAPIITPKAAKVNYRRKEL